MPLGVAFHDIVLEPSAEPLRECGKARIASKLAAKAIQEQCQVHARLVAKRLDHRRESPICLGWIHAAA